MTIFLPGVVNEVVPSATSAAGAAIGARVKNGSTTVQTPAATVRTQIAGSLLPVPPGGLTVNSRAYWCFNMTKTAAGSAASTFDISVGALGTVADPAVVSFTKPAGTAAVDEGFVEVNMLVKSATATGALVAEFTLIHNLTATGHAVTAAVVLNVTSGAVDLTPLNLNLALNITSGAADAITISLVEAELTECRG